MASKTLFGAFEASITVKVVSYNDQVKLVSQVALSFNLQEVLNSHIAITIDVSLATALGRFCCGCGPLCYHELLSSVGNVRGSHLGDSGKKKRLRMLVATTPRFSAPLLMLL